MMYAGKRNTLFSNIRIDFDVERRRWVGINRESWSFPPLLNSGFPPSHHPAHQGREGWEPRPPASLIQISLSGHVWIVQNYYFVTFLNVSFTVLSRPTLTKPHSWKKVIWIKWREPHGLNLKQRGVEGNSHFAWRRVLRFLPSSLPFHPRAFSALSSWSIRLSFHVSSVLNRKCDHPICSLSL